MSRLFKACYPQRSRQDIENIHAICLIYQQHLPLMKQVRSVSKLTEVASMFEFNYPNFWEEIEERIQELYEIPLLDLKILYSSGTKFT